VRPTCRRQAPKRRPWPCMTNWAEWPEVRAVRHSRATWDKEML